MITSLEDIKGFFEIQIPRIKKSLADYSKKVVDNRI